MQRRFAIAGLIALTLLFLLAYLSPLFYPWSYNEAIENGILQPPSTTHWFGTTQNNFDLYARTMRGLQKSLTIGLLGAVLSTGLAAIVGAFAGYYRGAVRTILTTIIDLLLVLPSFLLIAILSPLFYGKTWLIFVLLLAGFQWMLTARIVLALTLSLKEREFVQAARFMGVPGWKIIFRHILPSISSILIVDATVNVSALILAEVGLSFFGFGVQPPDVSLGNLIHSHWTNHLTFEWLFYFPAACLVALVLSINLIGDGLRDALDTSARV